MKKLIFAGSFIGIMLLIFIFPVGGNDKNTLDSGNTKESSSTFTDSVVENSSDVLGTEAKTSISSETVESSNEEIVISNLSLLEEFGEAYSNFSSINDRNEKLKKIMTENCIKQNGIDVKTAVQLSTEGSVVDIYESNDNKYAIILECKQNGMNIKVLLLVRVENGKISEMTYNTIKQEY